VDGAQDFAVRIRRHIIDASRRGLGDRVPALASLRTGPRDLAAGAASFLVVLAVLLHVLVGSQLARTVPTDRTVTRSTAAGATVLVPGELVPRRDVSLTRTRRVDPTPAPVADVDAYVVSTSTRLADGTFAGRDRWAGVQEQVTGRVVESPVNSELVTTLDANGSSVEERRPLRGMSGVLLRFPRDTPARDQTRWDPVARTVGVARFVDEAQVDGKRVLVLEQRSGATDDGVQTAADTTLWVRPETGAVVKEDVRVVVRAADGTVVLDARFVDDDASVRRASAAVDRAADREHVLGTIVPAMILVLGIMGALVAVLVGRTGRLDSPRRRGQPEEAQ
jgi:hypothetical protein